MGIKEKLLTDGSVPSFLVPIVFIGVVEHARDIGFEVLYGRAFLRREVLEFDSHIFFIVPQTRKRGEGKGRKTRSLVL